MLKQMISSKWGKMAQNKVFLFELHIIVMLITVCENVCIFWANCLWHCVSTHIAHSDPSSEETNLFGWAGELGLGFRYLELLGHWRWCLCHTPAGECSSALTYAQHVLWGVKFYLPDCVWWRRGEEGRGCGCGCGFGDGESGGVWSWECFQHESGQMVKNRPPSHEINNAT